jgi:hypothetical protein
MLMSNRSSDLDLAKLSASKPLAVNTIPCPGKKLNGAKRCMEMFSTDKDMMEHVMASHTSCSVSSSSFNKKSSHMCYFCETFCRTHRDMRKHLRFHTKEKPYFCPLCSAEFVNSHELRRHFHRKHPGASEHSTPELENK